MILSLTAILAGQPYSTCAQSAATASAAAEPDEEYARLIGSALVAYQEGSFRDARAWFERAHARWPSARTFWGLGVTAFELGRHAQSIGELRAALDAARMPLDAAQRAQARDIIGRAERYVGYVHVQIAPQEAQLWLDGTQTRERELPLAPGVYTLAARAPNFRDARQSVNVVAGQTQVVKLSLAPLDLNVRAGLGDDSARTRAVPERDEDGGLLTRWWFWTAIGVAVAGGVTAALLVNAPDDGPRVEERIEALGVHP